MLVRKELIAVWLLGSLAFGQNSSGLTLPEAPSAMERHEPAPEKTGSWTYLWDGRRAASNQEVLHDYQRYWLPTGYGLAGALFDAEVSYEYNGTRCVEGGIGLPAHPSRGQLYQHALIPWAIVSGVGFFFTKARAPWPIYAGMQGYVLGVHAHGAVQWLEHCQ
jgi:hypothetical protein